MALIFVEPVGEDGLVLTNGYALWDRRKVKGGFSLKREDCVEGGERKGQSSEGRKKKFL